MPATFTAWNFIVLYVVFFSAYVLTTLGHVRPDKYLAILLVTSAWIISIVWILSYMGFITVSWE